MGARTGLSRAAKAFYPSLPEPRRRNDLALWAVVVKVAMSNKDATKPRALSAPVAGS
jgi:hypothetical protein